VETTVLAGDGETVAIGGLITRKDTKNENKIPWLGDLPGVGSAFRFRTQQKAKVELLVIMTPRVVRTRAEANRILAEESRRMDWVLGDVLRAHGTTGMEPIIGGQPHGGVDGALPPPVAAPHVPDPGPAALPLPAPVAPPPQPAAPGGQSSAPGQPSVPVTVLQGPPPVIYPGPRPGQPQPPGPAPAAYTPPTQTAPPVPTQAPLPSLVPTQAQTPPPTQPMPTQPLPTQLPPAVPPQAVRQGGREASR
jgi:Bacterial type II and III secretion system protein